MAMPYYTTSSPFDHPEANIIIRSSDGVQYRTIKFLLSMASPIFKDMLGLTRPTTSTCSVDETIDGLPVVDLTESSKTLNILLHFCYPSAYKGEAAKPRSLSDVSAVLEAAKKYEMDGVRGAAARWLADPHFLEKQPLRVFAVACRHGFKAETLMAAKHTLNHRILYDDHFLELALMDAGHLYDVLRYHRACVDAAMQVAKDYSWIKDGTFILFKCKTEDPESMVAIRIRTVPSRKYKGGHERLVLVHRWWVDYMESTSVALQNESCCGTTAKNSDRVGRAFAASGKCPTCPNGIANDFRCFVDAFAHEIDSRISQVTLHLDGSPCVDSD